MAALVSHAMRRYPLSPPDGVFSYNLRVDSISSWSQTSSAEEGESALSRSMRYADPWLHGSVRGAPPGAVVLTPAFVLCSCPDYLSGSKKSGSKKGQSVCKKCKGTRVALPSNNGGAKFGTVRCYPTSSSNTSPHSNNSINSQVRAGTVRLTSSSRTSIIPSTVDPYDLMRRSRLNASSELTTSPCRTRSVSPSKRNSGSSRISGRRSILECDINPYELMTTVVEPTSKDTSITFVNGQRIRIRPQAPDPDYEDIDDAQANKPTLKFQELNAQNVNNKPFRTKPNRTAPDPPLPSPSVASETDQNNRKSILKKTDFKMQSSKFVRQKSGTHFYLPMPSTPRKKVQFLVEKSENKKEYSVLSSECLSDNEEEAVRNDFDEYSDVFDEETTEDENKVCTLRRTTSERFKVESPKIVFFDTMALRAKTPRGDSRDAFDNCDLQKLDGISFKRKISPRPKSPPPLPPFHQAKIKNESDEVERQLPTLWHSPIETKRVFSEENASKINYVGERDEKCQNVQKNTHICEELIPLKQKETTAGKAKSSHSAIEVSTTVSAAKKINSETILQNNENGSNLVKKSLPSTRVSTDNEEMNRPQAPPRKRSNHKQPNLNVQIIPEPLDKRNECILDDKTCSTPPLLTSVNREVEVPQSDGRRNSKQIVDCILINQQSSILNSKQNNSDEEPQPSNIQDVVELSNKSNLTSQINVECLNESRNLSQEYPKKTIVQIAPTSPVHRIQIKNEFPDCNVQTISVLDNAQRKTSIMINGDDCYSTVNVSDDVPLYQSSVVVRDDVPKSYRRSSSVYITGSFNEESSFDMSLHQTSEETENQADSAICKYENPEHNTKEIPNRDADVMTTENGDCHQRPSTPDMLREILRDPVEAVKRNLVPHICGKSDVSRRPRNSKPKNYHSMLLSSKECTPETQTNRDEYSKDTDRSPLQICTFDSFIEDDKDACSEHSSSTQYEFVDPGSDCYTDHSNRSSVTEEELANRTKFYELLADSALLEVSENEDHHYECISRSEPDPIYEEIEIPPPLPSNPPPTNLLDDLKLDKEFTTRSIFEGASKYDILSYLVDAKERGIVPEDSYTFSNISNDEPSDRSPKICHGGNDSSEETSLFTSGSLIDDKNSFSKSSEVERNDSGVGSETSKSSLSKYRSKPVTSASCEDCETPLEALGENDPLLCRKCLKKRCERKEIIMEIVETEEKYSRDLQIVLEEFYQPMLVAGLLTPEQLSTIFLNVEELLENSQSLAERLRDAVEIATEQGDEDLLTVNIGKLFLEAAPMLHAFETYCVRQGPASLLLASLEKEKELLRIFLRVSQMENTLLRRMNLNSFLMVPVQRVTKYPLLLARLYKVTSNQNEAREQLKEAQHKIELHLNHMNSQTKDVPSKLWRRIGSSGRRSSTEMDLVNIKLRKIAVDVLEWNHEEAKFALEGKLWFTQPTDNNWRKGRTIKLSPVNALLVINGKTSNTSKSERDDSGLIFPKHSPTREAALLLVRDKNGRYSLLRDPLYLDRCVIATDPAWQSYFEVQELLGKDTFIFKAEGEDQTKTWYQQLQFHAQGMGAWRKRRNALANIMMNGMGLRL